MGDQTGEAGVNKRRGFKRLAWALGLPYFGWWAVVGFFAYRNLQYTEAKFASDAPLDDIDRGIYLQMNSAANENLGNALAYGVFWPLIALIVAAVSYWVYRGFKPKT